MSGTSRNTAPSRFGCAGLDFIKAAFCPLEFKAMKLRECPEFQGRKRDKALETLEVGEPLKYARQFPYTDTNGHRKTGTQIVTAPFGLAPKDFDLFLGLYKYIKDHPDAVSDGRLHVTADFLGKRFGLPTTSQKDYVRIRSRIFRFSYAKYTNSAFWNADTRTYDLVNFGFFNIDAMSRITESRRPMTFQFDPSFLRIAKQSKHLAFDYELYASLSPALRRLYLIANRDGWNQRSSSIFLADKFAMNQIGFTDNPDRRKLRLQKLRKLFAAAEDRDLIRPAAGWDGYIQQLWRGVYAGQLAVRWSRGPALKNKSRDGRSATVSVDDDPLFAQIAELRDEDGKPVSPAVFQHWIAVHGRDALQKHILVILAQKEQLPSSFSKSEVAAFVDRVQKDYAEPDWYQDLKRQERLSVFDQSQPNQLSMELYDEFFA